MRIERVRLEHHRQAAIGGTRVIDAFAVEQDIAAGRLLQTTDQAQQGRFAAARRADEDDEFAVVDLQVDAVNDAGVAEILDNVFQFE